MYLEWSFCSSDERFIGCWFSTWRGQLFGPLGWDTRSPCPGLLSIASSKFLNWSSSPRRKRAMRISTWTSSHDLAIAQHADWKDKKITRIRIRAWLHQNSKVLIPTDLIYQLSRKYDSHGNITRTPHHYHQSKRYRSGSTSWTVSAYVWMFICSEFFFFLEGGGECKKLVLKDFHR